MRSKANEAVINVFIGANVTPKILLTSNNSLRLALKSRICLENTGLCTVSGFYPELWAGRDPPPLRFGAALFSVASGLET